MHTMGRKFARLVTSLVLIMAFTAMTYSKQVATEPFTVQFGDFVAHGELTYPTFTDGPYPTVILVHGSGMTDMDHTVSTFDFATGQMQDLSTNFARIAQYLAAEGYAVVRYNKRFVNGPNDADYMRYSTEIDLPTLAEDLTTVLEFARNHPYVDEQAIYLYGWSEGSTVAAHVAVTEGAVAGLILQTPVALGWRETFEFQINDVGVPFLRQVVEDGRVTDEALFGIMMSDAGGMVAKGIANYLADAAAAQMGGIRVNPALDFDGDGALHIEEEVIPGLPTILDFAFSDQGYFSMYADDRALPVLMQQVDRLKLPVLIVQGGNDANTPAHGAYRLAMALAEAGVKVTLKVYAGLGHSLGPAESVILDDFAPIADEPLADIASWLAACESLSEIGSSAWGASE